MKTPAKRKTIVLTGRAPVSIETKEWPCIVEVWDHDGTSLEDAHTVYTITIRQHQDGRRLVYGSSKAGMGGQSPDYRPRLWGTLIAPSSSTTHQTVTAIFDCAEYIRHLELAERAVQSLPAEEL